MRSRFNQIEINYLLSKGLRNFGENFFDGCYEVGISSCVYFSRNFGHLKRIKWCLWSWFWGGEKSLGKSEMHPLCVAFFFAFGAQIARCARASRARMRCSVTKCAPFHKKIIKVKLIELYIRENGWDVFPSKIFRWKNRIRDSEKCN